MLAEIFMLRLEATARAAKATERATSARFVPITLPATKAPNLSGGLTAAANQRQARVGLSSTRAPLTLLLCTLAARAGCLTLRWPWMRVGHPRLRPPRRAVSQREAV